ncbi:hypothetical protein VTO73DRAFT_15141 [Trametes versicolor]
MKLVCLACTDEFDGSRALATHKAKHCKVLKTDLGTILAKRKAEEDIAREAKRACKRERQEAEQNALALADDMAIEPAVPVAPDPATVSRAGRPRKVPAKFRDLLPTSYTGLPAHVLAHHPPPAPRLPTPAPAAPASPPPAAEPPPLPHEHSASSRAHSPDEPAVYRTKPNAFGLYRVYTYKPQRTPHNTTWEAVCDESIPDTTPSSSAAHAAPSSIRMTAGEAPATPYAPFPNITTFDIVHWQSDGSNVKSNEQINDFVQTMQEPGFNPTDLANFDAARESKRLDTYVETTEGSALSALDGWIKGAVEGVYYRSLTAVLQSAYQQPCVRDWDFVPFKLYWIPPGDTSDSQSDTTSSRSPSPFPLAALQSSSSSSSGSSSSSSASLSTSGRSATRPKGVRVRRETFDSDAMLEDDAAMRARPRKAGDPADLEYVIAAISFWSDETHLANFGTASLWPLYEYFCSQSKYTRGKPTAFAAHHIAYIPSLPKIIQDIYIEIYGVPATGEILTFLKRELMQEVWLLLLDDAFMYCYVHGLLVLCGDAILRRLFPRFNIHSADYPEKILQACLKYFAKCPCPRCKINKDKILEMGTRNDLYRRNHLRVDNDDLQYRITLTRRWMFEEGVSLKSVYMKRVLDPLSLTPTRNAFSVRFRQYGFNFYSLYVPDLLHEIELGVWKSIFTHILRILFRQIPTFGRIRRFSDNIADQRKLAGRDFENSLCTSIPAVEALLEHEDDTIVLDLIFDLNFWHCLAKLRAITDPQ